MASGAGSHTMGPHRGPTLAGTVVSTRRSQRAQAEAAPHADSRHTSGPSGNTPSDSPEARATRLLRTSAAGSGRRGRATRSCSRWQVRGIPRTQGVSDGTARCGRRLDEEVRALLFAEGLFAAFCSPIWVFVLAPHLACLVRTSVKLSASRATGLGHDSAEACHYTTGCAISLPISA